MVTGILNLSNYRIFVDRFWNASLRIGAGLGGAYWIVKDHGGRVPLDEHIYGAGFCMMTGAGAGLVALIMYPVLGASVVVGVPAYGVQQLRLRLKATPEAATTATELK